MIYLLEKNHKNDQDIPLLSIISRDSYWWLKRHIQVKEGSHAMVNIKRPRKRVETQLMWTEKLIDPIWRARREDHSYESHIFNQSKRGEEPFSDRSQRTL